MPIYLARRSFFLTIDYYQFIIKLKVNVEMIKMCKKFLCLITAVSVLFVSGCQFPYERPSNGDSSWKDEKAAQSEEAGQKINGWTSDLVEMDINLIDADKDFDWEIKYGAEGIYNINGKDHDIHFTLGSTNEGYMDYDTINVTVDGVSGTVGGLYCYQVNYAAVAELNGNEIVLFAGTSSDNDWRDLTILKFDGSSIAPICFEKEYDGDDGLVCGVSNTHDIDIELKDGYDFQMWKKTSSMAMWNLKKTYTVNGSTVLEQKQDKYETDTKEFLSPQYSYDEAIGYMGINSSEEYNKLSEGYVMCHKSYEFLKEGTYFTVLYDDGNDNIYIRTETGEEDWITIPGFEEREEVAMPLFYLAG